MGRKPQPSNAPIPDFMVEEDRGLNPRGVSYDREYRDQLEAAKGVARFGWESLPGVGTYYTVQDITEELEQENPNYLKIGMLAGTEVIGLIPGIGDAAASMIRKGADLAKPAQEVVEVTSSIPKVSRRVEPSYTDAELLEADDLISEWGKGNLTNPELRSALRDRGFEIQNKMISPKMTGDDLEVVGPDGNIVPWKDMPRGKQPMDIAGNPQLDNAEYAEKMNAFDVEDDMEAWKKNIKQYIADNRDVDPVVRTYPLEEAAQKFLDKEITREEYLKYIDEYKPVTGWDQLPREPSTKAMVYSLKPNQIERGSFVLSPEDAANLGVKESSLSVGDFFDGRLDVTAYKEFDTWIVAGAKTGEKGQHYAKAVHYEGGDGKPVILLNSDNPKKYETNIKTGERIGAAQQNPRGETYGKTPYAAISGYVKDLDVENIRKQAEQLLNDPEWVQLGFDPRRQGNFYVRREKSNAPIHAVATSAEEVIQIGPLVLAKNPVLDLDYEGYNKGGMAMDEKADFESLEAYKEFLSGLDDIAEWRDEKGDKYSSSAKRSNTFSYPSKRKSTLFRDKGVPLTVAGNEILSHKEYKDEYLSNNPSHEIIKADGTKDIGYSYELDNKSGAAEGATFLDALVAEFEVLANKEAEDKISEKEQVLLDAYRVFLTERTGMNEGGMAMDKQMDAVFKTSRTGYAVGGSVDLDSVPDNTVGLDPVSGNEIPLGSLPEEVRDDIPAQLSEGEYVVPADVVRYYGVKFFEDLRAEAKFGYQDMNENGRIGGEPPEGMEMIEPEDDMMFDISELEVIEVPDEPEGAFFGKLFGSKKKEPSVRERFDAAAKRDNSPAAIQKRVQAMQAQNRAAGYSSGKKAAPAPKPKSSGPSIAEQINFGGDYEDKPSGGSMFSNLFGGDDKKDKKPKDKSTSLAKDSVYTGQDDGETFAEKINFGGNYNQGGYAESGGYALSPGDEGYDEMGSLGLGSEGLPLGTGEDAVGGAVEMVAYVNDEGRVIYIMHINGVPQNEIPPGFYPRTEEENTQTSSGTGSQPAAQVQIVGAGGYNDRLDDMDIPMPEGVDYASLTTEEMTEMLEEQQSAKMDIITAGAAAVNPFMGLFLKGAMVHQARQLEREIERRLEGELTTQERTQLEGLLKQSKEGKPGLIRRIYGALKDEFTEGEEDKGPEAYTPEVAAGSVTLPTTPKPEGMLETSTDDLVKAFAPPEQFAMEEYQRAQQRKAEKEAQAAQMAAAAATGPSTADLAAAAERNRKEAAADARRRSSEVASAAKSTGKSIQEVGKAIGPSSTKTETEKATGGQGSQALGSGAGGMKKGGLASKKKKK